MSDNEFLVDYIDHFVDVFRPEPLIGWLTEAKARIERVRDGGNKLMFAGNGASASIASHYALDFTKQGSIRSVCFNDAALITAYANDFGYERWVAQAVTHHADEGDVAVLISTSGGSRNIVEAVDACRGAGVDVISFTGFGPDNAVRSVSDIGFWADSRAYNVVEAVHAAWLGMLCDVIIGAREYSVS